MSRAVLILATDKVRERALHWVKIAPPLTRIEFKGPKRTLPQNDRMWAMITDIAAQHLWHGLRMDTNDWKLVFLDALDRETRIVPNLAGNGFVNLNQSSSDLSVAEMRDMIEVMYAWGADPSHPVVWSEPAERVAA
jgi:hypothetical protein